MNFKNIIDLEENGNFDRSLCELFKIEKNEKKSIELKRFYKEALNRMVERVNGAQLMNDLETESLFSSIFENNTEHHTGLPRPIVSLTAIKGRAQGLKRTIGSLMKQDLDAKSINLFVSEEPYLVDQGFRKEDSYLEEIHNLGVNIYFTNNIGPYRKQYPIIKLLRNRHATEDSVIVTVDDDVIYPPETLRNLVENLIATESVSAYRGREIAYDRDKLHPYDKFTKAKEYTSLKNLGTGKNGIAYRLGFFPTDYALYTGPALAPTADDIWCKWVTAMYCIPTTIIEPNSAFDKTKDFEEVDPNDKVGLFHVFNAKGRNDKAIEALEIYFSKYRASMFDILKRIS